MMNKIPVQIITGFLGSGKTTLLNRLIQQAHPEKILVIENECGDLNVDGGLVIKEVEEVVELSDGCLCCTLSSELVRVLMEARHRRDQYDRLIIETTGIADPNSILQVFLKEEKIREVFELQQVVCLVDAVQIKQWLEESEEALRQVSVSDVVLINKTDLVDADAIPELEKLIEGINPYSKVFKTVAGRMDTKEILEHQTSNPKRTEAFASHAPEQFSFYFGATNRHSITSFTLSFDRPLNQTSLSVELNKLVNLYRSQVYRVKGFVEFPNHPNRMIVQSTRSTFMITEGSPWVEGEARTGKLVFIGKGLDRASFERKFHRFMVDPLNVT